MNDQAETRAQTGSMRVALVLRDFEGDPEAITRTLGISPTRSATVGDAYRAPSGRPTDRRHSLSSWILNVDLPRTATLDEQASALLDRLESARGSLAELNQVKVKLVLCTFIPNESIPYLFLSNDTIRRLAKTPCAFAVDIVQVEE
jgi:hypothetical protein